MIRLSLCLSVLLSVFGMLTARAADKVELTDLGRPVCELSYHVRFEVPRNKALTFSLIWNRTDSAHFRRADIEASPVSEAGVDGQSVCRYAVYSVVDGRDSLICSGEGQFSYATEKKTGFSAVLNVDASGASLSLGGAVPEVRVPVAFDAEHPECIGVSHSAASSLINNLIISKQRDAVARSCFTSVDSVVAYMVSSEDIREGMWEYLDRDVDPSRAFFSTGCRLATVSDGHGGYDIVLLSEENGTVGQFDIKGHLQATPFIDHYDLEWISADGNKLDVDTSADIEQSGAVLRLNFPLIKATLRFRRLRPSL